MRHYPPLVRATLVAAVFTLPHHASAQSIWSSATSGDWTNPANWTGGIPNASSAAAVFSNNWTGQVITNTGTNTVGQINARDTTASGGGLTLTGGSIVLDNGVSQAVISTDAGFTEGNVFRIVSTLEGSNGFERQGGGYLSLVGAVNTFTGTVRIVGTNAGSFLVVDNDANFGNSTNTIEVVLSSSATGLYNAASAGAFALNSNRSIVTSGTGDFWVKNKAGANLTIAGVVSGTARLRKNDSGDLTLTAANTFTGGTLIDGTGSIILSGGNNRLLSTSFVQFANSGIFDITDTSQTLSNLVSGTTFLSTVRGTGGALTVNGNTSFSAQRTTTGTSLDMSNLSVFTYLRTNQNFTLSANGTGGVTNTVFLAKTNFISAAIVTWGSGGTATSFQATSVKLGQSNSVNATDFLVAGFQGSGDAAFQSGLSSPGLKFRGLDGSAAMANLYVGQNNSGGAGSTAGTLDLGGGSLDATVTNIYVGRVIAGTANGATGVLTMPSGTVVAGNLILASKTQVSGNSPVVGTFNQGGGSVTATNLVLGFSDTLATTNPTLTANYNLEGGTLYAGTITATGANYGGGSVRNLTFSNGTLQNIAGANLDINGLANTTSGLINLVVSSGGGTISADALRNISVGANALISGPGTLTKAGNGTLTINSASTHTGATIINAGRIALGASAAISTNTLTFGGTSGSLSVGANSQTVRTITITNASGVNTVTGTGGSLTISGDVNQTFGLGNGASFDFSGLDSFTFNRTNREFKFETVNASGVALADINLAAAGAGGGTNTVAASFILVGGGNSAGSDGNTARLHLGTANTFNATSFRVGGFNAAGLVDFQSGLTTPSLTLRGADGVGAMTTWIVGETSSGSRNGQGVADLTGGSLSALVTNMTIGRHLANANNNDTSTLTMESGNLTASTLLMAQKTGTGAPALTSTFNQLGGDVAVDTVTLGDDAGAGATARLLPTININGGTFKVATVQIGGGAFAANSARTLNIGTATLQNAFGTNLTISSTNSTAGGCINVGLTGAATFEADTDRTITIGANTLLTGSGSLTKTGAGTLILSSDIAGANTGALNISNGVVNLAGFGVAAAGAVSSVAVATNAILLVSQSNQINDTAAISLSGGTISRGEGVSEGFGSLSLTTDSFLDFGTGAAGHLSLGTYQSNTTPDVKLTLNNFSPGNSFTFSNTLFTTNNIGTYFTFGTGYLGSSITDNGSSSFTITAIPEPSTYLAAAGLIGLMLWPARRRLLREAKSILGRQAVRRF